MSADQTTKRFTFDPRITSGDLLTVLVIAIGGVGAYYTLASRVSVLEEKVQTSVSQADRDRQDQKETIRGMRDDIKDIQRGVNALAISISARVQK